MRIRKATRADFDFIFRGQKEVAEKFEKREFFEGRYKGKIHAGIREGRIFIAEDEKGARLGFVEYLFNPPFTCLTGYLWLDWAYVIQSARGKGVGSALYAHMEKLARRKKLKGLACDVFVVNVRSQRFHEKQGFKKTIHIYQKEF
ncbi:MAG: GNAT family N-acetyltransferase [Candidatus Micrarchaeota archaeon]